MNYVASMYDKTRILLVDDDAALRAAMRRALMQDGFDVVEADCGDDALRLLDSKESFDLLVTDVRMPGTTDGLALAACWQERTLGCPVLLVSGSVESWLNGHQLGPNVVVLRKPFQRACLVHTVQHMLQGHRAASIVQQVPIRGAGHVSVDVSTLPSDVDPNRRPWQSMQLRSWPKTA